MNKIFFVLFVMTIFGISSIFGYEGESKYVHNTATYIDKITKSIAKQLRNNKNFNSIKEKTIIIAHLVDIKDFKSILSITKRVDENLIYAMTKEGFKIIDRTSLKILGLKNITADCVLVSSFIRYKYEMVINSRIIDKKSGLVLSVAQVKVAKKVLKEVNRLYNKNRWFKH